MPPFFIGVIIKATEYLVLLRGINVGGNNIIKMNVLKPLFEDMHFTDVVTYIQSGNVVFKDFEKDKQKLTEKIEHKLFETMGSKIDIVLLTLSEMKKIIDDRPKGFGEHKDEYRYYVVFLIKPVTAKEAAKEFEPKDGVDIIYVGKNVLYISMLLKQLTKSGISKIAGSSIYKNLSIRNWNTTEKLFELMVKNSAAH
jgi:uncharacterized protein (DUF1697 family)